MEEYTCGITRRGITTHRRIAQYQGLTLGKHMSAGPDVWRSATPESRWCGEELQQGSPRGGTELRSREVLISSL